MKNKRPPSSGEIQTLESAADGARSRKSAIRVGIKRLILSTRSSAKVIPSGVLGRSQTAYWIYTIAIGFTLVIILAVFLDVPVLHWVQRQDPWVKQLFSKTTKFGEAGWMLISLCILTLAASALSYLTQQRADRAAFTHCAQRAGFLFAAIAGIGLFVAILKQVVGRARPLLFETEGPFSFQPFTGFHHASFPSGDTTNAVVLALAGGLLFPRLRPALWLFAVWIGFGRVVTERHYVSDVIGATLISVAGIVIVRGLFARFGIVFRGPGATAARRPRLGRRLISFVGGFAGAESPISRPSRNATGDGSGSP